MPCTGRGVYVAGRGSALAGAPDVEEGFFTAAFLGAALFAAGVFFGAAFLAWVVPAFFFVFMGRTLQQRAGDGQVTRGEGSVSVCPLTNNPPPVSGSREA